jgi:hypothetical protein
LRIQKLIFSICHSHRRQKSPHSNPKQLNYWSLRNPGLCDLIFQNKSYKFRKNMCMLILGVLGYFLDLNNKLEKNESKSGYKSQTQYVSKRKMNG